MFYAMLLISLKGTQSLLTVSITDTISRQDSYSCIVIIKRGNLHHTCIALQLNTVRCNLLPFQELQL